jgi:nitroreductase
MTQDADAWYDGGRFHEGAPSHMFLAANPGKNAPPGLPAPNKGVSLNVVLPVSCNPEQPNDSPTESNDDEDRRQTMAFSDLIRNRYSVRGYKPDPVEEEKLQQVLEAARLAPTAANRQRFQLIVIHTEGRQEELSRIYGREWFVQPPIVICACRYPMGPEHNRRDYTDVDLGIVVDHLILAAAELGLGTCWIGAFDPAAAREVLGLPDEVEPVIFTPLGYPDDEGRPKTRKDLSELVRYERW